MKPIFRSYQTLLTKPGSTYTILERTKPGKLFVFFDFSDLYPGDEMKLTIYAKLSDWVRYEEHTIANMPSCPFYSIQLALPALRITITQTSGMGRTVLFHAYEE